jgi:hypothetical protein
MTFNDASGASYQRLGVTVLHTLMAGAVPDGVTDNSAAFTRLGNAARAGNFGIHIDGAPLPYFVNSGIDWSGVKSITGDGRNKSVITAVGATGTFSNTAVIYSAGAALTALPALSGDVAEGATSLTLASAPSLSLGDVGIIYNPTDSSYSGWRTYYRAGEFFEAGLVSGSTVPLQSGLYAGYSAAAVNLYKMTANPICISGFSVIAPGAGSVTAISVVRATKLAVSDFRASGSDYVSALLTNCFNVQLADDVECIQNIVGGGGLQYGISIANCQKVHGTNGIYKGFRHAIATGGGDYVGCVPNRNVWFNGADGETIGNAATIGCFNHHGNTEHSGFIDVVGNGAFTVGGNKNKYIGRLRIPAAQSGIAVYASELSGLDHKISGEFYCHGNPTSISRNTIDFGVNGNAFDSTTASGGTIDLSGLKIIAPDATSNLIGIINRGCVQTFDIDVRGLTANAPLITGALLNAVGVSGNAAQIVRADGAVFVGAALPVSTAYIVSATTSTLISGLIATGTQAIATTSGNSYVTQAITFPRRFIRAPKVTVSLNNAAAGADKLILGGGTPSQTGTTLTLYPVGSTFASTSSATVTWRAELNDAQ